jgi:hypothetical protein
VGFLGFLRWGFLEGNGIQRGIAVGFVVGLSGVRAIQKQECYIRGCPIQYITFQPACCFVCPACTPTDSKPTRPESYVAAAPPRLGLSPCMDIPTHPPCLPSLIPCQVAPCLPWPPAPYKSTGPQPQTTGVEKLHWSTACSSDAIMGLSTAPLLPLHLHLPPPPFPYTAWHFTPPPSQHCLAPISLYKHPLNTPT